jgi:CofD-related protein of GAK system
LKIDTNRVGAARQDPGRGPRILFFSGGTALRPLSRLLPDYTRRSIHIVTPFDSGGSSAELRRAFRMPAVGDLRNRLLALAGRDDGERAALAQLAARRLPTDDSQVSLQAQLGALSAGEDARVTAVSGEPGEAARGLLSRFQRDAPADFDLRGASLGNLMITGAWLEAGRRIEPALRVFADLVGARGEVRPVVDADLHLAAELEDGTRLLGQHRITGRSTGVIQSPLRALWLTDDPVGLAPASVAAPPEVAQRITAADLVCYPMGSFYSSVIANLLPRGVAEAIADSAAPKLYIPNLGHDPESLGLDLAAAVERILFTLRTGAGEAIETSRLLTAVLVDQAALERIGAQTTRRLDRLGVQLLAAPLVTRSSAPLLDARRLAEWLVSAC